MPDDLHELSALYALDVLDADERARFEDHLAECEQCRGELASLRNTASSLAFVPGPPPPAELRERILERARAEPSNVVSLTARRSMATSVAAALAVAATAAAVGLGIWAATLHHSLSQERSATKVLRDPNARRIDVPGKPGQLVVAPSGDAALTGDFMPAPDGKEYEAWIITDRPHRAGMLGRGGRTTLLLHKRLPDGATVAITLERKGGVDAPTSKPLASVRA
jgi:anti-sigma-K factor RskA